MAADEDLARRIETALPLRRFGTGRDIAQAVAFLCSDAASYITGTVLDCDGGMRLGDFHTPQASRPLGPTDAAQPLATTP
jgi:hypothetical protein